MWLSCRTLSFRLAVAGAMLGAAAPATAQDQLHVTSPDGRNEVTVAIRGGQVYYSMQRDDRAVIQPSRLGFEFRNEPPLGDRMRVASTATNRVDERAA